MSKRDDIIKATTKIIAEKGVLNATIGNILKEAKTGYGTLYNYFSSKEELYFSVYQGILSRINNYVQSAAIQSSSTQNVLELTMEKYIEFCINNMIDFHALEAMRYIPGICQQAKDNNKVEASFLSLIESCEQEGILKKRDPGYNVNALTGMMALYINYFYRNEAEENIPKRKEAILGFINALGTGE